MNIMSEEDGGDAVASSGADRARRNSASPAYRSARLLPPPVHLPLPIIMLSRPPPAILSTAAFLVFDIIFFFSQGLCTWTTIQCCPSSSVSASSQAYIASSRIACFTEQLFIMDNWIPTYVCSAIQTMWFVAWILFVICICATFYCAPGDITSFFILHVFFYAYLSIFLYWTWHVGCIQDGIAANEVDLNGHTYCEFVFDKRNARRNNTNIYTVSFSEQYAFYIGFITSIFLSLIISPVSLWYLSRYQV
jgi:hypothetical protein